LAGNIGCSIKKGQRVIVVGRLKMRTWERDGRVHHVAEIDAESVGHDLMWGSANFIRMAGAGGPGVSAQPAAAAGDDETHGNEPDENPDRDGDDSSTTFIDDATGEAEEVDEETGELKGAAA
jgi:single-strand DNA-binding protein